MNTANSKHKNQFFITIGNKVSFEFEHFHKQQFENYTLYYSPQLPVKNLKDGSIILGDFFSNKKNIGLIEPNNFLNMFNTSGGRWILFTNEFLFTDFVASKGVFYEKNLHFISSSLGIFRRAGVVDERELVCKRNFKFPLPPLTEYENVLQLMPGQYIDFRALSVQTHGKNYFSSSLKNKEQVLNNMTSQMSNYTRNCYSYIASKGYYHGLTGGTDSRLTLSAFLMEKLEHSTFTHKKNYLFMPRCDSSIPKLLSKKYGFKHIFTLPRKTNFLLSDYLDYVGRSVDFCVGSNLYYYDSGQMELLKGSYFIDNYYETGARWMHGKGNVGKSTELNINDFYNDNYVTNKYGFELLASHIASLLNDNYDFLDMLYFIKNFCTVSNLFCEMDYYMYPLVHMNSRAFFSEMLSAPIEYRECEYLLHELIETNFCGLLNLQINKNDSIVKRIGLGIYNRYVSHYG